jgi:hypothetical protein
VASSSNFEKVAFYRLLKKGPACARASAGRQMQVELCEIPLCGGPRNPVDKTRPREE